MDWYMFAPFMTATLLLLITPGPVVMIVAYNTLRRGAAAGFLTVIGVELGKLCLLGVTFAGLMISGELLPLLFRWLSLAGALYLVCLAVNTLRCRYPSSRRPIAVGSRKPIIDGLTVAFSNPIALVFYAAFFPQFINPDYSIAGQIIALGAIYLSSSLIFDLVLVLAFAHIRLPSGHAKLSRFAELGSGVVYFSIAAVTFFGLVNASN